MTDAQRTPTGRIFISYRRQDSAYPAGWLYDRLAERFGPKQVFKDVDSVALGEDFVEVITNAVGSCDVLLALIGQKWLEATAPDGSRRLDDPTDFVRIEIEAALERQVLLIPVLVDGESMPGPDGLPPSIVPLVRRQALELSPNRFRADTERLLDVLERTLTELGNEQAPPAEPSSAAPPEVPFDDRPAVEPRPEHPRRSRSWSRWVLVAELAAIAVLAVVIAVVLNMGPDDPGPPAGSTATSSATEPPRLGGVGAPVVLAHRGGDEEYAWQTLPAFEHAARIGAEIETDVRWTKDGVAVLVHDPGTTPGMECEGGNFVVADTTWPVLRDRCRSSAAASTNGKQYGIPTFADATSALAKIPGAEIYAEVKVEQTSRQVRQFVGILQNVRMTDRTVVTSSKPEELAKIRVQAEKDGVDLRTMLFISKERLPAADLAAQGHWGVAVEVDLISEAYVKELKDSGLTVMVWNINAPEQWELADKVGADLVMTDRPVAYGAWAQVN